MAPQIAALIELFLPYCKETETLEVIAKFARNRADWNKCHDLFSHIRNKTLKAVKSGNVLLEQQYVSEESCAKSIYNQSKPQAPFDPESPFWVVPNALALAKLLDIDIEQVTKATSRKSADHMH